MRDYDLRNFSKCSVNGFQVIGSFIPVIRTTNRPSFVDILNNAAMLTQDIAVAIDVIGVAIELALVSGGTAIGGPEGGITGLLLTWEYFAPLNFLETIFSTLSAGFAIAADWADDRHLEEATTTAVVSWTAGMITWDPMIDLAIDTYASGYNHGLFNGTEAIFNGEGLLKTGR